MQQFRHLLPQHSHNNIAVPPSFSLYNKASWFSSLFFKLASGCYNVHGYQWSNMLHDYHCSRCGQHHFFDPLSCLAFCNALDQHVKAYISPWGPLLSPIVLHWWLSGPSKADRRNFMRTLVPKSLWSRLSKPIPGSTRAEQSSPLGPNTFGKPLRPSQPLLGFARCVQYLRPHAPSDPPRIPAPPTSPQTRLKKSVQASVSQRTTSHSRRAKKLQTPVQPRLCTTPPPPPRPFPALLSNHAHGNRKNAMDHHKPNRPQSFGRPQNAP